MRLIGRTTIILWLTVCVSAVAVAYSNHRSRLLFTEWQTQLKQQQAFEVEWGQLLIEKSSLTAYSRLERIAAEKLNMRVPSAEQMKMVKGGVQ